MQKLKRHLSQLSSRSLTVKEPSSEDEPARVQRQSLNIAVIGPSGSGKTMFVRELLGRDVDCPIEPTMGAAFHTFALGDETTTPTTTHKQRPSLSRKHTGSYQMQFSKLTSNLSPLKSTSPQNVNTNIPQQVDTGLPGHMKTDTLPHKNTDTLPHKNPATLPHKNSATLPHKNNATSRQANGNQPQRLTKTSSDLRRNLLRGLPSSSVRRRDLNIWDVSGSSQFTHSWAKYVRWSQICLVFYDETNPSSLAMARDHVRRLGKEGTLEHLTTLYLVGTRCGDARPREEPRCLEFALPMDQRYPAVQQISLVVGQGCIDTASFVDLMFCDLARIGVSHNNKPARNPVTWTGAAAVMCNNNAPESHGASALMAKASSTRSCFAALGDDGPSPRAQLCGSSWTSTHSSLTIASWDGQQLVVDELSSPTGGCSGWYGESDGFVNHSSDPLRIECVDDEDVEIKQQLDVYGLEEKCSDGDVSSDEESGLEPTASRSSRLFRRRGVARSRMNSVPLKHTRSLSRMLSLGRLSIRGMRK